MAVGGVEADLQQSTGASGDKSHCGGREGRVSGPTKRTTAPMKREDAMQGSWSVAVDEKRPSLAVDDAVLVGAPAWWRTVAMDVVEDGGDGWGGGRRLVWGWGVLARTVYEWENGGRGTGNHVFGTRLSEIWESYELSPRLKFGHLVGWG